MSNPPNPVVPPDFPYDGNRPQMQNNMPVKSGQVNNGPLPVPQPPPPSDGKGFPQPPFTGPPLMNTQFQFSGQPNPSLMNGQSSSQRQLNQPARPSMTPPMIGSQFQQTLSQQQFMGVRPPLSGPIPNVALVPPHITGPSRMPSVVGPASISKAHEQPPVIMPGNIPSSSQELMNSQLPQGNFPPALQGLWTMSSMQGGFPQTLPGMTSNQQPKLEQGQLTQLPLPFHGQGQYSHQVGMALTQGQTPANSGPPSLKSSRNNSPFVSNQSLDDLEGQLEVDESHGSQDQEELGTMPLQMLNPQDTGAHLGAGQPYFPLSDTQVTGSLPPLINTASGFPLPPNQSGLSLSQRPGFPPPQVATSQPRFPLVGVPGQGPGFPPSTSLNHPTGLSNFQRPGFPPPTSTNWRPGFFPSQPLTANQRPGLPTVQSSTPSQQPGFPPPPSSSASQQPGLLPPRPSTAIQQPRFSPPPSTASQQPGFPLQTSYSVNQQPGFPPQPQSTVIQQLGFHPPPSSTAIQQPGFQLHSSSKVIQQQGFPPQPQMTAIQQPGFPPLPPTVIQQPGFQLQPLSTVTQQQGFPPPPHSGASQPEFFTQPPSSTGPSQQPGFPPAPFSQANLNQRFPLLTSSNQNTGITSTQANLCQPHQPLVQGQQVGQPHPAPSGKDGQNLMNSYPSQGVHDMRANFSNLSLQASQNINLLQVKQLIHPDGIETPKPVIPDNRKVNCSPDVFRCTMNAIPQTSALLNKARLPLGILIHPFKDLSQLPVIQSSVIIRCRTCRTYINPFVFFVDSRRWKCNLCYRVNELPDEFSYDPVSKTYGEPERRPEVLSATIEYIASSEYMLRPPQPAVYMYLIDVSFNAIETGYLTVFCEMLIDVLDSIPGDSRTQIGFIAYDSAVHFFNLAEGLSQPQMLTVSDIDDIFLPCPDSLLVNLNECKQLVIDLLTQLPTLFADTMETRSALGAALQSAYKMTTSIGGRVTVLQTILPTYGPGALQNREDAAQRTTKDISSLGPATDFYKKLALDCSAQQIAVDLFMLNGQYADLATVECISKYSGGCVHYYPSYHAVRTPHLVEKFETDLRRYLTRKIGFESVMRVRCSKGISIHTFHGNFFVRSTDLLSLPNVNPDSAFGMQMSIEEALTDMSTMCFQAALLYTSSKGERRIRVHTLCMPVTNQLSEIYAAADQQAIVAFLAKMAVDRSVTISLSDAREAIVNAAIDTLSAYGSTLTASQRTGSLVINEQLRLIPLYCLALLKSIAFRTGISTKLDDRIYAFHQCKTLPTSQLMQMLHPDLYPIHTIMDVKIVKKGNAEHPKLPLLQLSSANIARNGAYLLDTGGAIYLYVGSAINEQFCRDIFDVPNFASIPDAGINDLPELKNECSERLRSFMGYIRDNRPNGSALIVVREDGKLRMEFFQHFLEDRTEFSMSYHEFLQHIQKDIRS